MSAFILTCYFFSGEPEFPELTLAQRDASKQCAILFRSRQLCLDAQAKIRKAFFSNTIGVVTACEAEQTTTRDQ